MNIRWLCYNFEVILRVVVDNFGIVVIFELFIEDYLKKYFLWVCDIEGINLYRIFDIVYYRSKFFIENILVFFDILVEYGKK